MRQSISRAAWEQGSISMATAWQGAKQKFWQAYPRSAMSGRQMHDASTANNTVRRSKE
jgi:hypothetical protein